MILLFRQSSFQMTNAFDFSFLWEFLFVVAEFFYETMFISEFHSTVFQIVSLLSMVFRFKKSLTFHTNIRLYTKWKGYYVTCISIIFSNHEALCGSSQCKDRQQTELVGRRPSVCRARNGFEILTISTNNFYTQCCNNAKEFNPVATSLTTFSFTFSLRQTLLTVRINSDMSMITSVGAFSFQKKSDESSIER